MDALRSVRAGLLLLVPTAACAQPVARQVARWRPYMVEASARFAMPVAWIARVIRAESGGRTIVGGKPIRSSAGAIGLMQLMPATWVAMRDRLHLGSNADDPHDNIIAGTAYLKMMADRFGYPGLFAAYNAGPTRYAAYLAGRARLPAETLVYLRGITGSGSPVAITTTHSPHALLFVLRQDLGEPALPTDNPGAQGSLFAIRKGRP